MLDYSWPIVVTINFHIIFQSFNGRPDDPSSWQQVNHSLQGQVDTTLTKPGEGKRGKLKKLFWCEHQGIPDWLLTCFWPIPIGKGWISSRKKCFFFSQGYWLSCKKLRRLSSQVNKWDRYFLLKSESFSTARNIWCLLGREKQNHLVKWLTAIAMERFTHF